ncbi:MAG: DUF975 family protein, partial [Eubacterium sp.]|nr:DUF975 family protein [Eubacterium sp.]
DDFNSFGNAFDFDDEYAEDFNNFGNDMDDFDFEYGFNSFGKDGASAPNVDNLSANAGRVSVSYRNDSSLSFFVNICKLLLAPLEIALVAYYVSFIRGRKVDVSEGISTIFKNTFSHNYGKLLLLVFLKSLFTVLLTFLFIIPGIVYFYSTRFAYQIMADNPNLSPSQALQLSKKMVKGNRWELFVLDLSFIPWELLCIFVFPLIYVMPYVATTNALYYENFRIRALQQGRVTEDDFLSDEQRYAKYSNIYANPNGANNYQQGGNPPYGQPNNNPYYNQQNANPYYNPNGQYYQPPQNNGYQPNGYYAQNQNAYNTPPQQQENNTPPQAEYSSPEANPTETEEQTTPSEEQETKLYTDED